ncbi:MAG: hypothetical protein V1808_05065 [Candidatus Daviesbacteria bacterium]
MKTEDVKRIFYSHYTANFDWEQLEEILWMYQEGLLTIEKIFLETEDEFLQKVEKIEKNRYKYVEESGDSIRHQALKLVGKEWLESHFKIDSADILYEQPLAGFEVDVIDKSFSFPVECGDSNPSKVENYLAKERVKAMTMIPYPLSGDVFAFIFKAKPKFKKYFSFKKNYMLGRMPKR